MTGGGFELEDDEPTPPPRPATPVPPSAPILQPPEEAGVDQAPAPPQVDEATGLDTRTVAERMGRPSVDASGVVPSPPGWPLEAFQYPLRGNGPFDILAAAILWAALDALGALGFVVFLTWMLKPVLYTALLNGQFALIASTASGKDEPAGWGAAAQFGDFDAPAYFSFAKFAFPGVVAAIALFVFDQAAIGLLVLLLSLVYAAVVAISRAIGDRRMRLPWVAGAWIGRGPLHIALGCAGWLLGWVGEVVILHQQGEGIGMTAIVGISMRLLCVYMLFVSARALGVLGRQWEA